MERANQTFQDRLVKELRLRGISDIDSANAFLPELIADYSRRFAVARVSSADAHRPVVHSARELDLLLCDHSERTLSKNLTLRYRNTLYQLQHRGAGCHLRSAKVTVCEGDNGEVVLLHAAKELPYTTYQRGAAVPKTEDEKTLNARVDAAVGRQTAKPGPNRPWR